MQRKLHLFRTKRGTRVLLKQLTSSISFWTQQMVESAMEKLAPDLKRTESPELGLIRFNLYCPLRDGFLQISIDYKGMNVCGLLVSLRYLRTAFHAVEAIKREDLLCVLNWTVLLLPLSLRFVSETFIHSFEKLTNVILLIRKGRPQPFKRTPTII